MPAVQLYQHHTEGPGVHARRGPLACIALPRETQQLGGQGLQCAHGNIWWRQLGADVGANCAVEVDQTPYKLLNVTDVFVELNDVGELNVDKDNVLIVTGY